MNIARVTSHVERLRRSERLGGREKTLMPGVFADVTGWDLGGGVCEASHRSVQSKVSESSQASHQSFISDDPQSTGSR